MLKTACDLILDSGLGISLEALSLEDVIQIARVPRSSVYRQWSYKDAFIDDLLCYAAGPDGLLSSQQVFDQETIDVVRTTIAGNRQLLATAAGRRNLLCEVVRVGAGRNFEASLSPRMRMRTALMGAVGSSSNIRARGNIAMAIEAAGTRSRDNIIGLLEFVITTLGLRLRDPSRTVAELQAAGSALIQGMAMRYDVAQAAAERWQAVPEAVGSPPDQIVGDPIQMPGPDGQPVEWTLAALTYLGIVDSFLELDPGYRA